MMSFILHPISFILHHILVTSILYTVISTIIGTCVVLFDDKSVDVEDQTIDFFLSWLWPIGLVVGLAISPLALIYMGPKLYVKYLCSVKEKRLSKKKVNKEITA